MANNSKEKNKRILIVSIVLVLIFLVIIITFLSNLVKTNDEDQETATAGFYIEEIEESNNEAVLEKLYDMTEQERITYYCAEFFKLVDNGEYEEAYEILYDEYKENYFPTLASFRVYMQDYFPDDFSLDYTNIERLGDIYILWVDLTDTLNGSYGHNFSLNVVIRENDFDNFDLSFSKNSAVEEDDD